MTTTSSSRAWHDHETLGFASRTAKRAMRQIRRTLPRIPVPKRFKRSPGASPGIEVAHLARLPVTERQPVRVTCIDYGPDQAHTHDLSDANELARFLSKPRKPHTRVRWINVDGLTDLHAIEQLARAYHFHPLAIEDILHVHQRPKLETFPQQEDAPRPRLFIIARMLRRIDSRLDSEQLSIFLGHDTVLTFQQKPGDVWQPIRERLQNAGARLREHDAGFLLYTLLDAIVDHCFPLLEDSSAELERLDLSVLDGEQQTIRDLHRLKHELMFIRREIWPMRELINTLQRQEHIPLSETTRLYLRDVYDHTVQVIDLVETYRELAMSLSDLWVNAVNNRMGQVMKVLTVIATIFIPLTFLAGVYGMNFRHMPELEWRWAYPATWAVFGIIGITMLVWFRRKRWI